MILIFRIAAGIIIGLLAWQVISLQMIEAVNKDSAKDNVIMIELGLKASTLKNNISTYYHKNNFLPQYISDLEKCRDSRNRMTTYPCAEVHKDGVFYVKHINNWISLRPYTVENKIKYDCKSSIRFVVGATEYLNCSELDIEDIPKPLSATFDCNKAKTTDEKLICGSDRLIDSDNKLYVAYTNVIKRSSPEKVNKIKNEQISFIKKRRDKCSTIKCVDKMTRQRVSELELY